MKALSEHARALLNVLGVGQGVWSRILGRGDDPSEVIRELGRAGEPAAIPYVLDFLFDRRPPVALAAAQTLHGLVQVTRPEELARLDRHLREAMTSYSKEWTGDGWLEHVTTFEEQAVSLMGLASFHPSGYVRLEAVRRLATVFRGAELPFLLIRLNDWVWNVRNEAEIAVRMRIRADYAAHFVVTLPLVLRLETCGRSDHLPFLDGLLGMLRSAPARPALEEGLLGEDPAVRRLAFRLATDSEDDDLAELIEWGLAHPDPVIRLRAARKATARRVAHLARKFIPVMSVDPFMPVRREALLAVREFFPDEAEACLERALLDRHASIRHLARFQLDRDPLATDRRDFADFYRKALGMADPSALGGAVGGLAETGSAEDVPALMPFLSHRSARLRRAAVRGVAFLNGKGCAAVLLAALTDPSPRISREARNGLRSHLGELEIPRLRQLLDHDPPSHVAKHVLSLLVDMRTWESGGLILDACRHKDPGRVELGLHFLSRWLRGCRSTPRGTAEQIKQVQALIHECNKRLPDDAREQLALMTRIAPG